MRKYKHFRRLVLQRQEDGKTYLSRWGVGFKSLGSIILHKMEAPDPGPDLHNHPWWFLTIPLNGGYVEQREDWWGTKIEKRRPFRPKLMKLNERHTILKLNKPTAWSLVVTGPVKRDWGFFTPDGYVNHEEYEAGLRAVKRGINVVKIR